AECAVCGGAMSREPAVQRATERSGRGGVRKILGVERDAGERRPALKRPAGTGHRDRSPRAQGAAGAPADRWRGQPPAGWEQTDHGVVLAEPEAAGAGGAMALVTREPRRGHEAHGLEAQRAEPRAPARDPLARSRFVEGEKLAF